METQNKQKLSVVHWIGILVFGGIALLVIFAESNSEKQARIEAENAALAAATLQKAGSSTSAKVVATKYFSQEQICKAAIGTIMRRNPSTMTISKTDAGVTDLSYVRENDRTKWAYRCKLENNKVIWATDTGRWRTHPEDSVITYSENAKEIKIVEDYGDGSSTSEIYTELQLTK